MTTRGNLAQYIDHTLLRPDATEAEIRKVCAEAVEFRFKTVCIEAKWLPIASSLLAGSGVLPITVLSFPSGTLPTSAKIAEATEAIEDGAMELDMVLNRELLKKKAYDAVLEDVREVVKAAGKIPVKVILETSELTNEEKVVACQLCKSAGAAFVKTSTGFSKSGATEADVKLMRETVGPEMGVKASGGVRSYADAVKMIAAGATRLGTSASIAIVRGEQGEGNY